VCVCVCVCEFKVNFGKRMHARRIVCKLSGFSLDAAPAKTAETAVPLVCFLSAGARVVAIC